RSHGDSNLSCFFGGMVANLVGSFGVNLAIFKLSLIPLILSLATAALSGGLGGLIASSIAKSVRKLGILGEYVSDEEIDNVKEDKINGGEKVERDDNGEKNENDEK
ncbi:MAG: hypothetical protein RR458_07115, partial [Clostridia bacterium]